MIRRLLRCFLPDRRGNVLIEMALLTPILMTLVMTGVELTRYVLIHYKVERTSATIADLAAQMACVTEPGVTEILKASEHVMEPYDFSEGGSIVVSSIVAPNGGGSPQIAWQRAYGDGDNASAFGTEGGDATLPDGLVMAPGTNLIACEAYYPYEPILPTEIVDSTLVYRYAFFMPRFASLNVIYSE